MFDVSIHLFWELARYLECPSRSPYERRLASYHGDNSNDFEGSKLVKPFILSRVSSMISGITVPVIIPHLDILQYIYITRPRYKFNGVLNKKLCALTASCEWLVINELSIKL